MSYDKPTRGQRLSRQNKRNSESSGIGISVIIAWLSSQFLGVEIPPEVTAALSGVITAYAIRFKEDE